jgi:predicted RNA methylase
MTSVAIVVFVLLSDDGPFSAMVTLLCLVMILMPCWPLWVVQVLDLFSGSGSVGLEALSRGADSAAFVDMAKECCQVGGGDHGHDAGLGVT